MNFDPIVGNWEMLLPVRALALVFCALAFNSVNIKAEPAGASRTAAIFAKIGFTLMTLGYLSALWDRTTIAPLHGLLINLGIIMVAMRAMTMGGQRVRQKVAERVSLKKSCSKPNKPV